MIQWLLRTLGILPTPGKDLYRPSEKKLYGYWDGGKTVWQDPMVLYKKLMEVGPELSIDIKVANSPMKGNIEASNSLVEKIRKIFNLPLYDVNNPRYSGLTETQLTELLGHFLLYCEDVKKNIAISPTSPPTGEASAPPTTSAAMEDPATKSTLASNSTEEKPSTDTPTPSPTALESPSAPSNPDLIILGVSPMEKVKP